MGPRELEGAAGGAAPAADFAGVLELTDADDEAVRVEVCQPMLKKRYIDTLDSSLGAEAGSDEAAMSMIKLTMAKKTVAADLERFKLPMEVVQQTRIEAYKHRLSSCSDRVLQASEKEALDAARVFLELSEARTLAPAPLGSAL
ncbi:unnamed protein product [Prorocentrum cordatum]|uniref:Uncharacterized protein n=1 Tax=Prorocentrum cordatum TaxID=2364126 RepID=A0ABN9WJV5_9DINO|nr:unnamed protein product [Polarella glacialis]